MWHAFTITQESFFFIFFLKLNINFFQLRQLPGNDLIEEKDVNDLLARYASRAVELNVIRVVNPPTRENFHVSPPITSDFVVPPEVPEKSQWVPDDQVRKLFLVSVDCVK